MRNGIPIKVKKTCLRMREDGKTLKDIYNNYYAPQFENPCTYKAFTRQMHKWKDIVFPDNTTLECGTYEGFTAHGATVQVSKSGEIVQAWIRQKADEFDTEEFIAAIREAVEPYEFDAPELTDTSRMLEIPLFDMHWGVAFMDYYKPVMDEIIRLIRSRHWDKIVIPFGQDFFHNDSIVKGETTKGTQIEKVDMKRAVKEGREFMYNIIETALTKSNTIEVLYTPGNHDSSISWMFMQVLLERYGRVRRARIDDSLEYRKVISYGKNSIMITHGDSKQATAKNLAHIFPISFPTEFAYANVREIHCGHLHHESEADIYGVMVRRLSSGGKKDDWSDKEDFVGAHSRFMLFEWDLNKLKSIYYI